jgi:hypothetical protein
VLQLPKALRRQMKKRRLAPLFDALALLFGELLESEQTQSEKVAGARIAATGEE